MRYTVLVSMILLHCSSIGAAEDPNFFSDLASLLPHLKSMSNRADELIEHIAYLEIKQQHAEAYIRGQVESVIKMKEKEYRTLSNKAISKSLGTIFYSRLREKTYDVTTHVFDDLVRKTCGESYRVKGVPVLTSTDGAVVLNATAWAIIRDDVHAENLAPIAIKAFMEHKLYSCACVVGGKIAPHLPSSLRDSPLLLFAADQAALVGSAWISNQAVQLVFDKKVG